MKVLLDLPALKENADMTHPDQSQIVVKSAMGNVTLDIDFSSSNRNLILCTPVCTDWKAMLVLGPLLFAGVEVFAEEWDN